MCMFISFYFPFVRNSIALPPYSLNFKTKKTTHHHRLCLGEHQTNPGLPRLTIWSAKNSGNKKTL